MGLSFCIFHEILISDDQVVLGIEALRLFDFMIFFFYILKSYGGPHRAFDHVDYINIYCIKRESEILKISE